MWKRQSVLWDGDEVYIVKETRFTGWKSSGSKIRMGQYVLCQRDMMFSVKVTRCIVPQSCSFKKTVSTWRREQYWKKKKKTTMCTVSNRQCKETVQIDSVKRRCLIFQFCVCGHEDCPSRGFNHDCASRAEWRALRDTPVPHKIHIVSRFIFIYILIAVNEKLVNHRIKVCLGVFTLACSVSI